MVTPDLGCCAIPTRRESIVVEKKKKEGRREKKGAGRFVTSRKGIRRDS